MQVSTFIGLASVLLCTWLGVAFFRDVPVRSYPTIKAATAMKSPDLTSKSAIAMSEKNPAEER